jgi:para-nitrobenzyl esterase
MEVMTMMRSKRWNIFILCTLTLFFLTAACQKADKPSAADKAAEKALPTIISSSTNPVVQTESGKVRGYIHTGTFIFKGIPYAQAERFMPPQKPTPWEGIRSTLTYGPWSPQTISGSLTRDEELFTMEPAWMVQSEDCQKLNVWSRGINDGVKRPVMVWIHGGGYSGGSASEQSAYDGESLSKKGDVVVVSLNHRLNVLGFLDLSAFGDKYKYSGNVGMMDIVAALEWVKNNISSFGGDPGNVTIFGQSGGGGKVSMLMGIPSAKGLFHKAVVQSGSSLKAGDSAVSKKVGAATLAELGLKPEQVGELQKIPYDALSAAGQKAVSKVRQEMMKGGGASSSGSMTMMLGWTPVVDGDFLPAHPFDPAASELSKDVPVMIGSTINEIFPSLINPSLRNSTQAQVEEYLGKKYGDKAAAYIEEFGRMFPGYKPGDLLDFNVRKNVIAQARLKAAQNGAPVYVYLFAWQNPLFDGVYKAIHCMEIPFVFNNALHSEEFTGGSPEAIALADRVSQAWINFARTGNPNHAGLPEWPAFTDEKRSTMVFDNECAVKDNYDSKLLEIVGDSASLF